MLTIQYLVSLDNELTFAIRLALLNMLSPLFSRIISLDAFFGFFSLLGNIIFIWLLIVVLVLIFEERKNPGISKKDIAFVSNFTLAIIISIFLSQFLVKNIVQRPRPCLFYGELAFPIADRKEPDCPKDYSFPSSHATTAFAAATTISFFDKKRSWFYIIVAILISLSRIYLGYHYFLDIAFGALLGWLIGKLIIFLYHKSLRNLKLPQG